MTDTGGPHRAGRRLGTPRSETRPVQEPTV